MNNLYSNIFLKCWFINKTKKLVWYFDLRLFKVYGHGVRSSETIHVFQIRKCRRITRQGICGLHVVILKKGVPEPRHLRISEFSTGTDDEGTQHIYVSESCNQKITWMMKSFNEGERIYKLKDPHLCPYNSFVSYTDKLNSYNCFIFPTKL